MNLEILTLRRACELAGVAPKTVHNQRARRAAGLPVSPWAAFPAFLVGKRWFVRLADLRAFIADLASGNGTRVATAPERIDKPSGANRAPAGLRVITGEQTTEAPLGLHEDH